MTHITINIIIVTYLLSGILKSLLRQFVIIGTVKHKEQVTAAMITNVANTSIILPMMPSVLFLKSGLKDSLYFCLFTFLT